MSLGNESGWPPSSEPGSQPIAGPDGPNLLARFFSLFHAPRQAFVPPLRHSVWITALLVLLAVQITQGWLIRDIARTEMISSFQQNDRIPEEQKALILEKLEEGYGSPGKVLLQNVQGALGVAVMAYLLPALFYLLALNFGLGTRASFREVFAVTTFSNLGSVVRDVIRVPLMLSQKTIYVFLSPAAFVNPDNRGLVSALDRFDVFGLYRLVLLTLGLAAVSRLAPRRTAVPVLLWWLLAGLVSLAFWLSPIGKMFG